MVNWGGGGGGGEGRYHASPYFVIFMIRYNNFKNDPLSVCNCTPPYSAEYAISARSDLNPSDGTYPIPALARRCHGGTDNKVLCSSFLSLSHFTMHPLFVPVAFGCSLCFN